MASSRILNEPVQSFLVLAKGFNICQIKGIQEIKGFLKLHFITVD